MKTISSLNLKNKKVLLRVDLNSYVTKKKVHLGERLIAHCKTIKLLQKKKAITVILAHQGRPGQPDFASLKQHSKLLNKYVKVKFINSVIDKKAINKIKSLKPGETLLLENVRTLKDEFNPSTKNELIKKLAPLFNLYINDAFSISHRSQTSIVSFPKVLPHYPGPILIKELNALKKIKLKNTLFILAGAKPEENIHLMGKRNIITAGLFGQICMIAKGFNFGAQNRFLRNKLKILPQLKKKLRNQKTPIDFAIKVNERRKELKLKDFPSNYIIYDIGEETINQYVNEIKKAKAIFMKGTAGDCAEKQFCKGTKAILKAIEKSKAFSLIGGGELSEATRKLKINIKKINYVSLSGGALIEYIAGKKLPGLEVLNV